MGQLKEMDSDGTASAVMLELAQMTKRLRDAGIRATADYTLGTVVVSWGKPVDVDIDAITQSLADGLGGEPVPDESVLLAWAGLPVSEVDALTPALQDAIDVIGPAARIRSTARSSRRQRPEPRRSGPKQ